MRFGVVGTHFWARAVHGRGVLAAPDAELVGVWGRDRGRTAAAAAELGVSPYDDFDRLLDDVDAVTFAVPPQVQAKLALTAANRGRHVLLEKPVATSVPAAQALAAAVASADVAATVFVTAKFTAERRAWVAELREGDPWLGANAVWLGSAFGPDSPFDTPWRHDKGALWDVGPHLLAALEDALGPVEHVVAAALGAGGLVQLLLRHHGGASSSAAATLEAPRAASRTEVTVWGENGLSHMPAVGPAGVLDAFATAVSELTAAADTGAPVSVDLAHGVHVVEVLAEAERLATSR